MGRQLGEVANLAKFGLAKIGCEKSPNLYRFESIFHTKKSAVQAQADTIFKFKLRSTV